MKANELRIGNWIQDQFGKPEKIWAIDKYKVQLSSGAMYLKDIKDISGIPLTEELLLKCGFKGNPNDGYGLDVIELNYLTTDNHFQFEFRVPGSTKWFLIDVKYLHQLQNLYFALTGEEITINL